MPEEGSRSTEEPRIEVRALADSELDSIAAGGLFGPDESYDNFAFGH